MTTELQIPYYDQWLGPWAILPDALTQTLELFRKTDLHKRCLSPFRAALSPFRATLRRQHTVSLTLYRAPEPEAVRLSQRQRAFLDATQPGEAYRTSDYADTTGVVVRQAQRDLAELTEYGLFQKRGKGRAIVYLRTDKSP